MTILAARDFEIENRTMLQQASTIVWRNLIHIKRVPMLILDVTIQSVMFVLLFAYVFNGAFPDQGVSYKEFLLPGIMVQTILFACMIVAMGVTADLETGIVDRFKSLPMSRSAVLVGRSVSSLLHSSIAVTVMTLTGLLIGWRIRGGFVDAVLGFALLLLFGFSMIWLGILMGSKLRGVEAVQAFAFTVIFPVTFIANTFAPPETMPSVLRAVAEWNPVSAMTAALRDLWGNGGTPAADAAWPLQHAIPVSIAWTFILTAIFAPLAIKAFNERSRD